MNIAKRAVCLASGGLDSTTLCYDLEEQGVEVHPLFINYGQHCAVTERETLLDVLPQSCRRRVRFVDVADVYRGARSRLICEADLWTEDVEYTELYLPYRSLLLLTLGAAFAQAQGFEVLYAAFINSNHAQEIDCSTEFFGRLDVLLGQYGGVDLRLPYREMSKVEVARRALELGAPIGRTFSCQASALVPCGACPNCVDRLDALLALDNDDKRS